MGLDGVCGTKEEAMRGAESTNTALAVTPVQLHRQLDWYRTISILFMLGRCQHTAPTKRAHDDTMTRY